MPTRRSCNVFFSSSGLNPLSFNEALCCPYPRKHNPEGYVSLLLALLLVLLLHVAVIVGLFGHHKRNAFVIAPANTLSAALQNSTQGYRELEGLFVALSPVKECFCSHCRLPGWSPEKVVLPSDSLATYRAERFFCMSLRKRSSEWHLQTVPLQLGWSFNILFFLVTFFKPAGNSTFSLFPQASCAITVQTLWIHKIKSELLLLTTQDRRTLIVMHYL